MAKEHLGTSCVFRHCVETVSENQSSESVFALQTSFISKELLNGKEPAPQQMYRKGWSCLDTQLVHCSTVEARTTSLSVSDVLAMVCRIDDKRARQEALRRVKFVLDNVRTTISPKEAGSIATDEVVSNEKLPVSRIFVAQTCFWAVCSPDSKAMGFLLQTTMSCPCALSRQVAGAG